MGTLTGFTIGVLLVSLVIWIAILLIIRWFNFKADGERRTKIRSASAIEYHNKAIYRDFELFFKFSLTIIGGVVLIAMKSKGIEEKLISFLLNIGGKLQFFASILFSIFVILHQKSKVERWAERYKWWKPLTWQECWMVAAMWLIGVVFAFRLVPELVKNIPGN
ncbi:MAG: hypothetical protein PVH61_41120 [Candidatus Aminicenantes bacterium]|jgi:hypothetical protein